MIISGQKYIDTRGTIKFFNDFTFETIRRFYTIEHPDTSIVRAWQGHRIESKWFFATKGSFLLAWVMPDDWLRPSEFLFVEKLELSANNPILLHIPGGYANGFKALESNSILTVFSDLTIHESRNDSFIFDKELWFDWSNYDL